VQKQIILILETALDKGRRQYMNKTLAPRNGKFRSYKCRIDWCERPAYAKRYCNMHYIRSRSGADMNAPIAFRNRGKSCRVCNKPLNGKAGWGLCTNHFKLERKRIVKKALIEALGGKCSSCGEVYPDVVFDFHHLEDKDNSMAYLISNANLNTIAKEAAKCTLLCANCHRIEHFVHEND
jgi:hypothetical protein